MLAYLMYPTVSNKSIYKLVQGQRLGLAAAFCRCGIINKEAQHLGTVFETVFKTEPLVIRLKDVRTQTNAKRSGHAQKRVCCGVQLCVSAESWAYNTTTITGITTPAR